MLPYYELEENNIIEEEEIVQKEIKKCSKCKNEKIPEKYIKNKPYVENVILKIWEIKEM